MLAKLLESEESMEDGAEESSRGRNDYYDVEGVHSKNTVISCEQILSSVNKKISRLNVHIDIFFFMYLFTTRLSPLIFLFSIWKCADTSSLKKLVQNPGQNSRNTLVSGKENMTCFDPNIRSWRILVRGYILYIESFLGMVCPYFKLYITLNEKKLFF